VAAHRPEPVDFYPERLFEEELERLVEVICKTAAEHFVIHKHIGLDLLVFITAYPRPRVRMIEAKAFNAQRPGGVGFGDNSGKGPQVDILLSAPSELRIMDQTVRWALADATMPVGTERYAFFNCTTASQAAMNGVARGKQNNFSVSMLKPHMTTWDTYCDLVETFLLKD
jgi:hypothetical protein